MVDPDQIYFDGGITCSIHGIPIDGGVGVDGSNCIFCWAGMPANAFRHPSDPSPWVHTSEYTTLKIEQWCIKTSWDDGYSMQYVTPVPPPPWYYRWAWRLMGLSWERL